ncbi:hypothetical protein [Rhizobium laguerreae]|uniref:hypothetical protein n=1 Tax=Rhizobium laguerreae TaxID=1076926 RepID=UPI001C912761|nr:hypothetical protein [Rhizobium laguerreae]MBY3556429.1 hypothetical protein [Rhizobium laguerreae]
MDQRLRTRILTLQRPLRDLERLDAGDIFAPELMAVPVLSNWAHIPRSVSCLEGIVEGHPNYPDGQKIVTSELFASLLDEGEHFARTFNEWYRVATPGLELSRP